MAAGLPTRTKGGSMASIHQPFLFRWNDVDAQSDLNRLRLVLESLPDEDFMSELEQGRGR